MSKNLKCAAIAGVCGAIVFALAGVAATITGNEIVFMCGIWLSGWVSAYVGMALSGATKVQP